MTKSYLSLVRKVLNCPSVANRTGINAKSYFGHQLQFSLKNNKLPIITTKRMPFNTIARELFWFMRGETNQKLLEEQNVNIWKGNSSRAYLDSRKLYDYKEYETLGPIYGFQWRHFGAKYTDCHENYTGCGVDQLIDVINTIKTNPSCRRLIISTWNPTDLDKMALPPCHVLIQFHVDTIKNELSSHLYQRSADLMLGVPFNITSYSLLTHIIAKICGLTCGRFIHSFGNVHIYDDHIVGAEQQLHRKPKPFPQLDINLDLDASVAEIIKNLNCSQFKLLNYKYDCNPIKFNMSV